MCWVLLHNDGVQGSMIIDGLRCLIGVLIDKDVKTVGIYGTSIFTPLAYKTI